MKKISQFFSLSLVLSLILFGSMPSLANGVDPVEGDVDKKEATMELQKKADVLMLELKELKQAKKMATTRAAKKKIRTEAKSLRGELMVLEAEAQKIGNGGLYIGTGTLLVIIIILLLI